MNNTTNITLLEPIVSVITPCYNYGMFLSETLDSLLAQTYTNWQCIIVNDGSTDNTEEVALKYVNSDRRFKYIYQENKGLPGARNTALLHAKGKYIQFLDADDLLESNKLFLQVELFEKNNNIDFVYGNMLGFSNEAIDRKYTSFKLANHTEVSGENEIIIEAMIRDTFFLPGCVIFKKEICDEVGTFNESLYGLEDWEYWYRIALYGKQFYFDDRVGTRLMVRDHESNMSKAREKMLLSRIKARTLIINVTEKYSAENKHNLNYSFYKEILRKHQIFLMRETYEYNIHYGSKVLALKSLLKYSYYDKKPFFPFYKFASAILQRLKN